MGYFTDIHFSSISSNLSSMLDIVTLYINSDMTTHLQKAFTEEEILITFHQIHPTKVLGPDGMPTLFFHKFWHVIYKDVLHNILSILNSNVDSSFIDKTHIILIPKFWDPKDICDFKPTSLYNVIFKVIKKKLLQIG